MSAIAAVTGSGIRWLYALGKPGSTSEVVLDVPRYVFNWQTYYLYRQPLNPFPRGT